MPITEVKLESNGRVLLPADVCRALGVEGGDTLLLEVREDGAHLWTRAMAAKSLQDAVARCVPAGVSLVEELRAMRQHDEATLSPATTEQRNKRPA